MNLVIDNYRFNQIMILKMFQMKCKTKETQKSKEIPKKENNYYKQKFSNYKMKIKCFTEN